MAAFTLRILYKMSFVITEDIILVYIQIVVITDFLSFVSNTNLY